MKLSNYVLVLLIGLLVASAGLNIALYKYWQDSLKDTSKSSSACSISSEKMQKYLSCNEFAWVDNYVDVLEGDIPWSRCEEGSSRCVFWEDYNRENPSPKVRIKGCIQEGTRLEDGKVVTGLPEGEHIIIGATIRPCEHSDTPLTNGGANEPNVPH